MSFVLLFYTSEQVFVKSLLYRALVFFAFAVGMYGVGTSWIHNSFVAVEGIGSTVSIWVMLAFLLAAATVFTVIMTVVQFFLSGGFSVRKSVRNESQQPRNYSIFGVAVGWVVFELQNTLTDWELAFPWLQAGYAYIDTWLAGLATVGGVTLISICALTTAVTLYQIRQIRLITLTLALFPWLFGFAFLNVQWTQPLEEKEIVLVQSNFTIMEKVREGGPTRSLQEHRSWSQGQHGADFVIWPEGSIHARLTSNLVEILHKLAANMDASLIVGTLSPELVSSTEDDVVYNIAAGISKHAPKYEEYQKFKMVPFGETIPFRSFFKPVIDWLKLPVNAITSGPRHQDIMVLDGMLVGISICFEITFPAYIAERSRGAEFLVSLSEDGWFGNSIGPQQHMQIARMRALETGRYLARATTKGVSGIIDPKGKIVATMPANQPGVVRGTIQSMDGETWFVKYISRLDHWVGGIVGGGLGGLLAVGTLAAVASFIRKRFFGEPDATVGEKGSEDETTEVHAS